MRVITVRECESTNTTLREMLSGKEWYPNGTALRAISQTHGRGQRGNHWESDPGMNITMSIVLRPGPVGAHNHFLVSEAIAVGTVRFLENYDIAQNHDIAIKWPNDILVDNRKIAGILLENTLGATGDLLYCVAGIGLNVNQTLFSDAAPNAVSMSELTGCYYDLDELACSLVDSVVAAVDRIAPQLMIKNHHNLECIEVEEDYMNLLWRRSGLHKWRDAHTGEVFEANVLKVAPNGCINLMPKGDAIVREYYFKEVFPVD